MRCNAEFYHVGKIPPIGIGRSSLQRSVVLQWFYSPRAVGTTLSVVNALYLLVFMATVSERKRSPAAEMLRGLPLPLRQSSNEMMHYLICSWKTT